MKRSTTRGLALTAVALLGLSLLAQFIQSTIGGAFAADYYDLPLREFVTEEQRPAMEQKVMELTLEHANRPLTFLALIDLFALIAIVLLLMQLRRESPGASTSTGASPHSAN
jgi:uncharacterized protein involved in cysteine biosynthesis